MVEKILREELTKEEIMINEQLKKHFRNDPLVGLYLNTPEGDFYDILKKYNMF